MRSWEVSNSSAGLALMYNGWVVLPRQNPHSQIRLVCFPYAGGGTTVYRRWLGQLPQSIELCLVRPPGRESLLDEPPERKLNDLVPKLADALQPLLTGYQRIVFFGHSMGALIAFELSRHIRQTGGRLPDHLVVSGHPAPQLPRSPDRLRLDTLTVDELVEYLRLSGGTPEALLKNREVMGTFLPTLQADLSIVETYTCSPSPPLACRISAYGGRVDPDVSEQDLSAWAEQTTNQFSLRMFDGGHFYINGKNEVVHMLIYDIDYLIRCP